MCEYKDEKGNCNAPIPFKCGDECAIKPLLDTIEELRKKRDLFEWRFKQAALQKYEIEDNLKKLEAEIKDLEDLARFKTKTIDELTEERNYYKRQMEFVVEQKEKLEKQLNITD